MDIAQFHHVNQIPGKSYRPAWRDLKTFGDADKIRRYVRANEISRLVLLEDFVGSGTQAKGPLSFAINALCPETPILFCPLVISEVGRPTIDQFVGRQGFSSEPVFTVPARVHVYKNAVADEERLFAQMREIIIRTFPRVKKATQQEADDLKYPFGFESLGMLLVLYTNCPNNTLPMIWHDSPEWRALFPRVSRA
jgi:hypothetical protein